MATLILAEGQAAFDPLIALSLDAEGTILDTLYRGPGAPGSFRIPADDLSDSSRIRLEGYAGGRLVYRLDFPAHGGDTLDTRA